MTARPSSARVRPFAPYDLPGIYRICSRVDARGRSEPQQLDAPELPGHIFAGPYLKHDAELAWVVADDLGVAGYIVATADAVQFERWREKHWFPPLRDQHPPKALGRYSPDDERYLALLHAQPREAGDFHSTYPAELHIKIDPRMARQGWGTKLIDALTGSLLQRGVTGVHLAVSIENASAIAFYAKTGFEVFARNGGDLIMTRPLASGALPSLTP